MPDGADADGADADGADESAGFDVDALLDRVGFDAAESALTRRQATVFVLRERGQAQADIAERLGTSRANVAKVEKRARRNVDRARETVAFAATVRAPVQIHLDPGTSLYDVPDRVYAACDDADVRVVDSAPDLIKRVSDAAGGGVREGELQVPVLVSVSESGALRARVGESGPRE